MSVFSPGLHLAVAGLLLSEIEPTPDPQMHLRLIADAGGLTAVDGEIPAPHLSGLADPRNPSATLCGKNKARAWIFESSPRMVVPYSAVCAPLSMALRISLSRSFIAGTGSVPLSLCIYPSVIWILVCGMLPRGCGSRISAQWARSRLLPSP